MSLIYKKYLESWLLESGGFRLNLFQFSGLFSDFRLSGLSTTHAHTERLIQSLTGFLDGWRHIHPEMIFSRRGSAVSYTSIITVRTGTHRPAVIAKTLTSARGEAYLLKISLSPANHMKPNINNSSILLHVGHLLTSPKKQFHVMIFLCPTFLFKQLV